MPLQSQTIFVEAGHGKKQLAKFFTVNDPGACNGNWRERDFAKEIAGRVLQKLQAKKESGELSGAVQGVGIVTDATIQKKMQFVNTVVNENKLNPQRCLGIAVHMNSSTSSQPSGFEVWHQKNVKNSEKLATYIAAAWDKYEITPLRPKPVNDSKNGRYGRFYIDDTSVPYVIIETSFISNLKDVQAIQANFDRVAECIAHGIMEYLRNSQ